MSKRKYCPTYIKYGFIAIEHVGESLPQYVICMKTISNSAVKPSLLKRHLGKNHVEEKEQDESYFYGEMKRRSRRIPRTNIRVF